VLLVLGVFVFQRSGRFKVSLLFTGVAVLAAAPWLARSALATGTPFYPFLMFNVEAAAIPDAPITSVGTHGSLQTMDVWGFLTFPWNFITQPHLYDGWSKSPGALVLFLGIPGLIVGGKRARAVGAFCIAGGMGLFFFQQYARYFLPFLIPMMAVAAVAACRLKALRWGIAAVLISTYAYGLTLAVATVHFKVPVAIGMESRDAYLTRRVERHPAFEWVNKELPQNRTVLTLDPRSYYIHRPTYQNILSLANVVHKTPEEQLAWLRDREIAYLFFPQAYATESPLFSNSHIIDMLNIWRNDERHFKCIKTFSFPRRSGEANEQVEIYEIHYDN
jgi:hypothetical protein